MGKGSARRQQEISQQKFADQWDAIFGKKKEEAEKMQNMPHDQMVKMAYGLTDKEKEKK